MPELNVKLDRDALEILAGKTGSVALAQWLHNLKSFGYGYTFMRQAAHNGHLNLLVWGRSNFSIDSLTFYGVAERGNLSKWRMKETILLR